MATQKTHLTNASRMLLVVLCSALLSACFEPLDIPAPAVEGPIGGNGFLITSTLDVGTLGYRQDEYFISGTATGYVGDPTPGIFAPWRDIVADSTAPYKSRLLVYRPIDPAAFNGTVVVEWLNVSAGFDAGPDWTMLHTELARTGAVWVGVTAQYVGVEGRAGSVFPLHLKGVDAARYGSLSHPGDSYSYDIYSQAGQAVRGLGTIDVLDGLTAERVIAVGESQSAARMLTYANAFADITDIYDGYLIHSRLGGAAPLSQAPQPVLDAPDIVRVRPLLAKPVLMLQTETDVVLLGSAPSRQRDGYNFRLWEIAGTGHADLYTLNTGANDPGNDPAIAAVAEVSQVAIYNCDLPVNAGPQHWVAKAAIRALDTWIATGDAPSEAPRIQLTPDESAIARDANGNALGGVRTPYLDAPLATLSGEGQTANGFCGIFGTTALFDAATLATLYADDAAYESAVIVSTDQAVADGFILAEDAALIKAHAATVTLP